MIDNTYSRRRALLQGSHGFGAAALWHLLANDAAAGTAEPHFVPRAKNVIFLFMMGGPSQVDLFDPKPKMAPLHGQPFPDSLTPPKKSATGGILDRVLASPQRFRRYGQSGMDFSDLLPHTAKVADELCMIRSMHCEQSNHDPAQLMLLCGTPLFGNPSMGAWLNYGLGSGGDNMPGYLVLTSDDGHGLEGAGSSLWGSGFMPSAYRGVSFRNSGDPILHLGHPPGISTATQRARLDAIRDLNQMHQQTTGDVETTSRIEAYEMAFRMQTAAPELLNFDDETAATQAMYGVNQEKTQSFGTNCLLARRMVERGVRFVHLIHSTWDHHSDLNQRIADNSGMTDQPTAALIQDLRQRGLLDDTLVVWAGEFGRTPMGEVRRGAAVGRDGRDHHPNAFSLWMAGGGIKPGCIYGATDDFGYNIVESPVHVHDLQATILHQLGINHEKLTYRHAGRDYRLTDVSGTVVRDILL
jgi:hypothetical protein